MKRIGIATGLLLAALPLQAAEPEAHAGHGQMAMAQPASKSWTSLPLLKSRMSGEDRASRSVTIVPQNIAPDSIEAWSNDLADAQGHRVLPLEMGGAKLDKPASGGFHLLTARETQGDTVRMASTVYYFGERGGKNPTAMFMQTKEALEIVPQPFPREHSRYRANEDWPFLVRFKGQPLAGYRVLVQTSNGSRQELLTDAHGVFTLHVPDDFKLREEGAASAHGMRRGADMVLAATHTEGATQYLTAFNSSYGEDAYANRDLAWGVGFTLIGMLGAAPLLRQRKNGTKNGETGDA